MAWIRFYDEIESHLGKGDLADISDYGAKIGNNVARVVELLHFYQHDNTEICKSCMIQAIEFGYDCIDSFKAILGEKTVEEKPLWRLHNDGDIDYFDRDTPAFIRLKNNRYLRRKIF